MSKYKKSRGRSLIVDLQRKQILILLAILIASFLSSCQAVAGEPVADVEPLSKQPYTLLYNDSLEESAVKNLLIVSSADPDDVEAYDAILKRNNYLVQIIESHWALQADLIQISEYNEGDINNYDALFLIEDYDKIPLTLMQDVVKADDKEIIFAGYRAANQLSQAVNDLWSPESEKALETVPIPAKSVNYKGVSFNAEKLQLTSVYPLFDQEEASNKINILSTYIDIEDNTHPLIVDINERYLIFPFELPHYYETYDYSIVFLDCLHYALGHHEPVRKALLRIEDVNPYTYRTTVKIRDAYEFLKSNQIPFHIALIARYINPDKHIDLSTHEARIYLRYITLMVGEGYGTLVQHGYTHQTTGISSIDYEYWDETNDAPLPYDTEEYVINTIKGIKGEMEYIELPIPDVFETPHYALSDLDNEVINRYYPLRYEHIPNVGSLPIPARIDNRIFFPSNLGYIAKWDDIEPAEKEALLKQVNVFEDPVASFFWHPWRDVSELEHMVTILQENGYEFVSIYDLVEADTNARYHEIVNFRKNFNKTNFVLTNAFIDVSLTIVFTGFSLGSTLYLINVLRVSRYTRKIKKWGISMEEVQALAAKKNVEFPNLAVLVPARNEGFVIGNTIRRLVAMEYPKEHYRVIIIVDEREFDDNVEILTKDEADKLAKQIYRDTGINVVHVLEVPRWYSGEVGNLEYSNVKSTKGRALNYAIEHLSTTPEWEHIDMLGVLDADGRLDKHVLKEIAYRRIKNKSKLLQGSVFQVSNYGQVSIVGVAAGLELAIHHLTELPARMLNSKVQFLAGTNYFIDKELVKEVLGWDQYSLVEDAELALRLYAEQNVIAEWILKPELEQSPENFKIYRKQRERWARGHLVLLKAIRKADITFREKVIFYFKVFISQFRFITDLFLFSFAIVLMFLGAYAYLSPFLKWLSVFLVVMSLLIMDTYGFVYRKLSTYIDPNMKFSQKIIQSLKLFSFFPIQIIVQAIPRILALWNYLFGRETGWYKTERTKEAFQSE
jgi:cellulose synthase/poly-beta-1,6-N-acetylglucosamine synthase-like glycosyltransferase